MTEVKIGCGFFSLLTLLFIGLKLTGHITWNWLLVLSPLWLPLIIGIIIVLILYVIYEIKELF